MSETTTQHPFIYSRNLDFIISIQSPDVQLNPPTIAAATIAATTTTATTATTSWCN